MPTQAPVTVAGKVTASITNTTITNANNEGTFGVIPTSVAGTSVAVGAKGSVTFTTATAVTVNGCFSSTVADNYRIEFDITTSAASTISMTLALVGTPAVTSYDSQRLTAINIVVAAVQTLASTSWVATGGIAILAGRHIGWIELFKPAIAVATGGLVHDGVTANPMTTSSGIYDGLLQHQTATAYDGFQLTVASGTMAGGLRVFAKNNL